MMSSTPCHEAPPPLVASNRPTSSGVSAMPIRFDIEALTTAHWQASALAAGAYFVRLQTRDPSGLESDFSAPRSIHISVRGVQTSDGLGLSTADGQPVGRR